MQPKSNLDNFSRSYYSKLMPKKLFKKIFLSLILLSLILSTLALFLFPLPPTLAKDLTEKEILLLYLKVNAPEKAIKLNKIEAKYGVASENRYPTDQVVRVVKEEKILFETSFQLDNMIETFTEGGPAIEYIEENKEEVVAVPYVKGSEIIVADRQPNEQGSYPIYLSIGAETIESFLPFEKERANTEDKITLYKADQETGEALTPLPKNFWEFLKQKVNDFFQNILRLLGKIYGRAGEVKGTSSGRNLKVLFITGVGSCHIHGQTLTPFTKEEFDAAVKKQLQDLSSITPFNEFKDRISFISITISSPLSFIGVQYPQECPGKSCPYSCAPDSCQIISQAALQVEADVKIFLYKWPGRSLAWPGGLIYLSNVSSDPRYPRSAVAHEIGHNFACLADEYVSNGADVSNRQPPLYSNQVNCSLIVGEAGGFKKKCLKWPDHPCFEGCTYRKGWGKYTISGCLMYNGTSFCEVCANHIRQVFNGGPCFVPEGSLTPTPTSCPTATLTPTPTPYGGVTGTSAPTLTPPAATSSPKPTVIFFPTATPTTVFSPTIQPPTLLPTPTSTVTLRPTSNYYHWCDSCRIYDLSRRRITRLSSLKVGQKVYLTVTGVTNHPQGITKARFRVDGSADNWCQGDPALTKEGGWCVTTRRYGNEYFVSYTFNAAKRYNIESMVYNPELGWF